MRVAVLMPVYGERERLGPTLRALREAAEPLGGVTVFLVDDGSEPPLDEAEIPARSGSFRVVLGRHAVNLGQGAALETARQLALRAAPAEVYATMDSDGQHRASDLAALCLAIDRGADVALGDRFSGQSNVPPFRRVVLRVARLVERLLTGLALSDAHNGFRAFSRRALEHLAIKENRMAHATELTYRISRAQKVESLRVVEVPVSIRYTEATLDKGQSSLGAFTILRDLFHRYLFEER